LPFQHRLVEYWPLVQKYLAERRKSMHLASPKGRIWLLHAILRLLALWPASAAAHEQRDVGPYQLVVGFAVERAFEGQKNGVDLRVSEGEGEAASPVEGLHEMLQVEVTHVESGISQVMPLRAVFGAPGRYTNDWIPSMPGVYRFRFTGMIGNLAIDEVFESGPDTFGSVEPAAELYFPEAVPAARELEGATRGAQAAADEALSLALSADTQVRSLQLVAMGAMGLALLGVVLSAVTWRRTRHS
jgi:hypothetical protein